MDSTNFVFCNLAKMALCFFWIRSNLSHCAWIIFIVSPSCDTLGFLVGEICISWLFLIWIVLFSCFLVGIVFLAFWTSYESSGKRPVWVQTMPVIVCLYFMRNALRKWPREQYFGCVLLPIGAAVLAGCAWLYSVFLCCWLSWRCSTQLLSHMYCFFCCCCRARSATSSIVVLDLQHVGWAGWQCRRQGCSWPRQTAVPFVSIWWEIVILKIFRGRINFLFLSRRSF